MPQLTEVCCCVSTCRPAFAPCWLPFQCCLLPGASSLHTTRMPNCLAGFPSPSPCSSPGPRVPILWEHTFLVCLLFLQQKIPFHLQETQKLKAGTVLAEDSSSATDPTPGDSQQPVTPAPQRAAFSSCLCGQLHSGAHGHIQTHRHITKIKAHLKKQSSFTLPDRDRGVH